MTDGQRDAMLMRGFVRGMLMNLRLCHHWQHELRRKYEAMPAHSRPSYTALTEINLQPDVHAVLAMIGEAKADGHLSEVDAARLVEGLPIEILCAKDGDDVRA